MITGYELVESQKLYSTGDEELDDLLEKAFCEGYEYAQREFATGTRGILGAVSQGGYVDFTPKQTGPNKFEYTSKMADTVGKDLTNRTHSQLNNIQKLAKQGVNISPKRKQIIEKATKNRVDLANSLSKWKGHSSPNVIQHALPANDWSSTISAKKYNTWARK